MAGLPIEAQLRNLAELLAGVAVGPQGSIIATKEYLVLERRGGLEDWLHGREQDPVIFERLWTGIETSVDGNQWRMKFNVFKPDGGVTVVEAAGTISPLTIRKSEARVVKPAGEFSYPLVG